MSSSSELWSDGSQKWWISHEGIAGPKGLDFLGSPPDVFQGVRAEIEETQKKEGGDQADVDYIFEIPLLVAKSITGFKHDEICSHVIGDEFKIMTRTHRGGLFSRLFGKK